MKLNELFAKRASSPQLPRKRSMNLYMRERTDNSLARVLPAALIAAVITALICRFGVVDRLRRVDRLEDELRSAETRLSDLQLATADFNDVRERYMRSGDHCRTDEERALADRLMIFSLIREDAARYGRLTGVSVVDNTASIQLEVETLDDVASFRKDLAASDKVADVHVITCVRGESEDDPKVTAALLAEFLPAEEE